MVCPYLTSPKNDEVPELLVHLISQQQINLGTFLM